MNCLFTMKIRFKIAIILLFISLLLSSTYSLEATVEDKPSPIRGLYADTTSPIIIYNITQMSTDNIVKILVYDAESNLTEVTAIGNPFNLSSSAGTFNVTWSYINYTTFPPPVSKGGETLPAPTEPEANTFDANVSTDLFVVGGHNNIEVDAENEEGLSATASVTFCDTYECWGRGGGDINNSPQSSIDRIVGVPIIHFDLTDYFCCGCVSFEVLQNGASVLDFTYDVQTIDENNLLYTVELNMQSGAVHKSAIILDPAIYVVDTGSNCDDCTCPTALSSLPIIIGLFTISIILTIKRKKKR